MGLFDMFGGGDGGSDNPYAPQRGLFGVFDNSQASRMLMASSILQAISNNAQHNMAPNMLALNRQETTQRDLEKKYNSAMRYADKIEKSNPERAADIRGDWTLAAYAQKKKMDYDLDPAAQAKAAWHNAQADSLASRQKYLDQFTDQFASGQPANASPGQPSQGQVPPAVPVGPSPPTAAVGGTAPVMTPEGVPTATPLAFGSNMPPAQQPVVQPTPAQQPAPQIAKTLASGVTPEIAQSNQYIKFNQQMPAGSEPLDAGEFQQMRNALARGMLSKEGNPAAYLNTQLNRIIDNRRAAAADDREATTFEDAQVTRERAEDARAGQRKYLLDNGVDSEVVENLKTNKQLQEAYDLKYSELNDPKRIAAREIAAVTHPGDETMANLFANDPDIAKRYHDKWLAENTGHEAELKKRLFKPTIEKSAVKSWEATPEAVTQLGFDIGLPGLTKREAIRIRNSDKPSETINEIYKEKIADDAAKDKTANNLRKEYIQQIKPYQSSMDAANHIKGMVEDGTLEKNPSAAQPIVMGLLKTIDDSVAKEGEVNLASRAQALIDTVKSYFNRIEKGEILGQPILKNIAALSLSYGEAATENAAKKEMVYNDYADSYGVDKEKVTGSNTFADKIGQFGIDRITPTDEGAWTGERIDERINPQSGSGLD